LSARSFSGIEGTLEVQKHPRNSDADSIERGTINSAVSTVSRALAVARNSLEEAELIHPFASVEDGRLIFLASLTAAQQHMRRLPNDENHVSVETKQTGIQYGSSGIHRPAGHLGVYPLLGISALLIWERESHTLQRLITTPTSKATFCSDCRRRTGIGYRTNDDPGWFWDVCAEARLG